MTGVEIVTPGGLPVGMREEDLGHKSVPRNPLLFSLFYRTGLVEQSGIKRIRDDGVAYGVADPMIQAEPHWLPIVFSRS